MKGIASEKLVALQLGRYFAGGMERAKTLINSQIAKRFVKLEKLRKEQERLRAAVAKVAEWSGFIAPIFTVSPCRTEKCLSYFRVLFPESRFLSKM